MASEQQRPRALSVEEFTEELAADLDEDADEIRAAAEDVEIDPPWEGEIEEIDEEE